MSNSVKYKNSVDKLKNYKLKNLVIQKLQKGSIHKFVIIGSQYFHKSNELQNNQIKMYKRVDYARIKKKKG